MEEAPKNGRHQQQNKNEQQLTASELRHYEADFDESDPKWKCWPERKHVQKVAFHASVATVVLAVLLLLLALLLLRPPFLRLSFVGLGVVLCAVSAMSFFANLAQNDFLFVPYLFVVWLLTILSFAFFFFLVPMFSVPDFWQNWVLVAFGIAQGRHSLSVVRLITVLGAAVSFASICLLTLFNFIMLRARNFAIAKRVAIKKGYKTHPTGENGERKQRKDETRRVRVMEMETSA
ncbi:hypothetical protein niasHS_002358 [Heterodera schachtii]|uniref:Uncharacterized protein n=1 Tax=Heterodera schachtii TaxID=97005 RepID=A0ABD2KJQ6_HETSC